MNIFQSGRDSDARDDVEIDHVIEGERDTASMQRGLRMQNKVTNLLIVVSAVALAGLVLWRYYASAYDRREKAAELLQKSIAATPASLPPLKTPMFPEPRQDVVLPPMSPPPAPAQDARPANLANSRPTSGTVTGVQALTPAQQRMKQRLDSPLVFKLPDSQAASATGGVAASVTEATDRISTGNAAPMPVSHQLGGSGTRAYLLADPSMTITQGTKIPCHVVEALDTTLPGLVTCIQAEDVRSTDGRVVLLERGTKWVGQQANGIAQGQRRVGIVWSRGETPNHVLVDVDSGGADWLGRPGIVGQVDNHFWDRFGAAILLSVIGDVGSYLAASRQGSGNNNTTIALPNVTGGAQQVMSDVLKSTLNIPPTLTAPEASRILIHVARDLDFRDVYALRERPTITRQGQP